MTEHGEDTTLGPLAGAFPELASLTDADLEWAKQQWPPVNESGRHRAEMLRHKAATGSRALLALVIPLLTLTALWLLTMPTSAQSQPAAASTMLVNSSQDAVDAAPGDGVCASTAGTCTLRAAVMEANALAGPNVVVLPSGAFTITLKGNNENAARTGDIDITDDLTLQGAGAAVTIIDGRAPQPGDDPFTFDRVLEIHPGIQVTMVDLTIRNAWAPPNTNGGGVRNSATLTMARVHLVQNQEAFYGVKGGGIFNAGNLIMTDCLVAANSATGGYADSGGGIHNAGTLRVSNSEISDNVSGSGSGLANVGTAILDHVLISGNNGGQSCIRGAGIRNAGNLTVTNSLITDNEACYGGAGITHDSGTAFLSGVDFVANHGRPGSVSGVAIDNYAVMTVTHSAIVDNTGSGEVPTVIASQVGRLTLENCTISGNDGGVHGLNIAITNCTMAGNRGYGLWGGAGPIANSIVLDPCATFYPFSPVASRGHNIVLSTSCLLPALGDQIGVDPQLGPLQDNGGGTFTRALLGDSPAIDAADPALCPATDQRGLGRFGSCDVGAYERLGDKRATPTLARRNYPVTFTIDYSNGWADAVQPVLVDPLPADLVYEPGSLAASTGTATYDAGVIRWTGALQPGATATVTFRARVAAQAAIGSSIVNVAHLDDGREHLVLGAAVRVSDGSVWLPIIHR